MSRASQGREQLVREARIGLPILGLLFLVFIFAAYRRMSGWADAPPANLPSKTTRQVQDPSDPQKFAAPKNDTSPDGTPSRPEFRPAEIRQPRNPSSNLPAGNRFQINSRAPAERSSSPIGPSSQPLADPQQLRRPQSQIERTPESMRQMSSEQLTDLGPRQSETQTDSSNGTSLALPAGSVKSPAGLSLPSPPISRSEDRSPPPTRTAALGTQAQIRSLPVSNGNSSADLATPRETMGLNRREPQPPRGASLIAAAASESTLSAEINSNSEAATPKLGVPELGANDAMNSPPNEAIAPVTYQQPRPIVRELRVPIESGDSYWSVAERAYGSGQWFRVVHAWLKKNHLDQTWREQSELVLPTLEELSREFPSESRGLVGTELLGTGQVGTVQMSTASTTDGLSGNQTRLNSGSNQPTPLGQKIYKTRGGETPFELAGRFLDQASQYAKLIELNRDKLPVDVGPNTRLAANISLLIPQ